MADKTSTPTGAGDPADQRPGPRGRAADGLYQGPLVRGAERTVPARAGAGPEDLAEPQHDVEHRRPGRARSRPDGDARSEERRRRRLPRRGQAGGRLPRARFRRRRNAPHPRLVRAEYPVPLYPPDRVRRRHQGRLPAVPAAAREFRRAVRALDAGTGGAPGAAAPNRRTESAGPHAADRGAGRRFLGNGARDPVCARRRPDGSLGTGRGQSRGTRALEEKRALSSRRRVPALARHRARPQESGRDAARISCSSCPRAHSASCSRRSSRCCTPKARIAWASKGFELDTGKLPHQVAREVLGPAVPIAVLSGPTFAKEVGQGLPTAIAVASPDDAFALSLAERISSGGFRAYTQSDIVGVEIGGAVKNVLAIATGVSDGLGYGSNSRVFLITRGLAELMRLGVALGAKRETLMGLAGLGDLVLTCTDDQSRNRRFGRALAAGKPVDEAIAEIGQVVEGYHAAKAVHDGRGKAGCRHADLPACLRSPAPGRAARAGRRDDARARSHAGELSGRRAYSASHSCARCAAASAVISRHVVGRRDLDDVHAREVDAGEPLHDRERLR